MLEHDFRDLRFEEVGEFLEDLGIDFGVGRVFLGLGEVLFDVLFVLIEGVIFGNVHGEVIVQFRKLLLLDGVQFDFEDSVFRCQLFDIVLRELDVDIEFLADFVADDLVFEARDELAGAEGQLVAFALAAFERDIVDEAFEVDDGEVVEFGFTVDFDETGAALLLGSEFGSDVFVRDFGDGFLELEGLVVTDLDFGFDRGLQGEGQAVFADFLEVDVEGVVDDLEAGFVQSGFDSVGINDFECIFVEDAFAVISFDHAAGRLTFAEARDGDVLSLLLERLVDGVVEGFAVNVNDQFVEIGIDFFGRFQTHFGVLLSSTIKN